MQFARFMAGPVGRGARIVAGIAIAGAGILFAHGALTIALIAVGVVVFLAGFVNFCLVAPVIGAPFSGRKALSGR